MTCDFGWNQGSFWFFILIKAISTHYFHFFTALHAILSQAASIKQENFCVCVTIFQKRSQFLIQQVIFSMWSIKSYAINVWKSRSWSFLARGKRDCESKLQLSRSPNIQSINNTNAAYEAMWLPLLQTVPISKFCLAPGELTQQVNQNIQRNFWIKDRIALTPNMWLQDAGFH